MTTFSSAELAAMKAAQEAHMMDKGKIGRYARTYDTDGNPKETWTLDASEVSCGIDQSPGSERRRPDMTVVTWDAVLRLPSGTNIDAKDRFTLTKRFGATVTNVTYEVAGPIEQGPSGLRILLKKVEA